MGWYAGNSGRRLHRVAMKYPNHWGVHDMHGNVEEWCLDVAHAAPGQGAALRATASNRMSRVRRGGSIYAAAPHCTAARRNSAEPWTRHFGLGFRVVRGELPLPND
jgi:formylglycine-generating enzyme required for sulfatase activity